LLPRSVLTWSELAGKQGQPGARKTLPMYSPVSQLFTHNISSTRRLLRGRVAVLLVNLAILALTPTTRALLPPPPPAGGYPNNNTAEGTNALLKLTTGTDNTATGFNALSKNTAGGFNTATGSRALQANTTGNGNTAIGVSALFSNTTGFINTATGSSALFSNTTGSGNTATGNDALNHNTTGKRNTATGFAALYGCFGDSCGPGGSDNTATGTGALGSNAMGSNNTATGSDALTSNGIGSNNTAGGFEALSSNFEGTNNTAEGFRALKNNTGSNNIALGSRAGIDLTTGSNNIDIGALGIAGESNTIRIGRVGVQTATYIRGISGATVASGVTVVIASDGHLGTVQSSARFKDEIKPMDRASEAILALQPVTFHYKADLDPAAIPQFGLVAEQVEKVDPDLVVRSEDGKVTSVRYEAVNAMLLNEFLKEHRKIEEQQLTITRLESKIARQELTAAQQQKQIEALTATVQKVSDQIAFSKPAPQLVGNP
jgi:uncharacterized coiled-coil protein SlyX